MSLSKALSVFALFLLMSSQAFAFSIDQNANVNTDGSAKFSDPDEQRPGFMISGDQSNVSSQTPLSLQVNRPNMQDNDQGASAFEHAITLQGNH